VAEAEIAITSEATTMSNPSSRAIAVGDPAQRVDDRPQRPVVHVERPLPRDAPGIEAELVAPVDVIVDQRASRLFAAPMAWKSPVKMEVDVSIGTTWA